MWTDEEASTRLKKWLESKGWQNINRYPEDIKMFKSRYTFEIKHRDIRVAGYLSKIEKIFNMICEAERITSDSLLHDLNIIKQIGRLEYTSKWIYKILAGQKTMDVLPTQHACGYYELWDADRQEVRGIVYIAKVERVILDIDLIKSEIAGNYQCELDYTEDELYTKSGFDSILDFLNHHRTNFQSIKYATTYLVVDMKGDGE